MMDNKQIEEAVGITKSRLRDASIFITTGGVKEEEDKKIVAEDIFLFNTFLSLAQLFLSVKGVPEKKGILSREDFNTMSDEAYVLKQERNIGYNLCHDEFTAWLVGRMEEIETMILAWCADGDLIRANSELHPKDYAIAIKTMILGGEELDK